jgi:hypothetical protein
VKIALCFARDNATKNVARPSGFPGVCPPLTGATKPADNIPKFDSKVWPVATTILSTEIGASIPNDVNIFVDETTKLPRSIDETAAFVCELLKKQTEKEAAAA